MNKNIILLLAVILIVGFGSWVYMSGMQEQEMGTNEAMMIGGESMTINLSEQNSSGESGTATLVEENGKVKVTLSMSGFTPDVSQPAHIHVGECPDVGAVKYPLTNVLNGESVTMLDTTLDEIRSELPLGLNVHKSVPEASVYTACGDLY